MKTAKELLYEYLEKIQTPNEVALLFADDGAIELPYLKSVNGSYRTEGRDAIEKMLTGLLRQAPDFHFLNIQLLIDTPEQVFAEYEVDTLFNGKPYKQLYMGRLVAVNGKIKLIREGMDMIAVTKIK